MRLKISICVLLLFIIHCETFKFNFRVKRLNSKIKTVFHLNFAKQIQEASQEEVVNISYNELLQKWILFGKAKSDFSLESALLMLDDEENNILMNELKNVEDGEEESVEIDCDDLLNKWIDVGYDKSSFKIENALLMFADDRDKETTEPKVSFKKKLSFDELKSNLFSEGSDPIPKNTRSVGIDLGTTNSAVSIIENGQPRIIPVDDKRITPSIVAYSSQSLDSNTIIVGENARRQLLVNPTNTFSSIKRSIGKTKEEKEIENTLFNKPRIFQPKSKSLKYQKSTKIVMNCPILKKKLLPEEISSEIIKKLILTANNYLKSSNEIVTRAVITVPAYFNTEQCKATEKAGILAGLTKVKLLREPEAAALAYGLLKTTSSRIKSNNKRSTIVLVFDLGGGTFDVSVLEINNNYIEVIGTSGDNNLGGDDFDNILTNWIIEQINIQNNHTINIDIKKDIFIYNRIREIAEKTKMELSNSMNTIIDIPYVYNNISYNYNITRGKYESLTKSLLTRLLRPLREVAIMSGINLPGESAQIGLDLNYDETTNEFDEIRENNLINNEINNSQNDLENNNNELLYNDLKNKEIEGKKLAKLKSKIRGKSSSEFKRIQKELGTINSNNNMPLTMFPSGQILDDVILIGGATKMPAIKRLVRVMTGIEPKININPDEAVSLGAAILAGIIDGDIKDMQVMSAWQSAIYRTFANMKQSDV